MAISTGKDGNVAFSGSGAYDNYADTNAHIFEFTLNEANDEYDSTSFASAAASSDVTTTEFGNWQATGSLSAFLDKVTLPPSTVHAPGATASTLTLTYSTGNSHAFPAHLFNITFGVDRQTGLNILNCDFESTGDLTIIRPAT